MFLRFSPMHMLLGSFTTMFEVYFVLWMTVDLAGKIQATKVKAGKANDTAIDVLNRLKDLNLNLMGIKKNYSKLEEDVNKANNLIKDPEKNSKTSSSHSSYHLP